MNAKVLIVRLLPFLYIITRIIPILKNVSSTQATISTYWPSINTIHNLLRTDNKQFVIDGHEPFPVLQDNIHFNEITFSYNKNDAVVLKKVDFSIPKGKTTAFVGHSGAGKSTIINILMRFYDPDTGEILIDGKPLKRYRLESYRSKIGIVSQDTFLFHDTMKKNIVFGLENVPTDERIIAAAQKAGAHEFIMNLSDGYNTVLGERGVKLSGGQKQRISIARAILRDPEILVLDEATSSLDTYTEKLIYDAIKKLRQDRTVIMIAHRLSTIQDAEKIIVLKDGRVVETGDAQELIQQNGEYYRLAAVQLNNFGILNLQEK